jgi:hypothetical protein
MRKLLLCCFAFAISSPAFAQTSYVNPNPLGGGYTTTPGQVQPTIQTKQPTLQTDMYGRPTPPPGTDMYGRPPPPTTDNYGRALPPTGMYGR